jgi:putative membrane protein
VEAAVDSAVAGHREIGNGIPIKGYTETMNDPVNSFLTEQDKRFIEERIREAEKTTSGEIVVKVVASSDGYPAAGLLGSSMFSLALAIAAMLVAGSRDMWLFLMLFGVLFILLNELFKRVSMLKRPFVSAADMHEEVEQAAAAAFYRRGIYDTAERTGILIYISVFEHRVRVIADKGISAKVEHHLWQEIVDTIITGIRQKRQGAAIADAVKRCGRILSQYFPIKSGDRNELSDSIIMGRSFPS